MRRTIEISGASDDLIEIEGAITEEFTVTDSDAPPCKFPDRHARLRP